MFVVGDCIPALDICNYSRDQADNYHTEKEEKWYNENRIPTKGPDAPKI